MDDIREFFENVVAILAYGLVAVVISVVVFEVMSKRYDLVREIQEENSVAAAVLGGAFVLGVFYTIATIAVS